MYKQTHDNMKSMRISCKDFNLSATLESGQVFGFTKAGDTYEGRIMGKAVKLRQRTQSRGEALEIEFSPSMPPPGTASGSVRAYFDLDRDLSSLFALLESEPGLAKTLPAFRGLRIIRQDPWEALACFIISSNNNVKRIQGIWQGLSVYYCGGNGFPAPLQIAKCHERTLRQLGLGYRAPFLLRTAQFLSTNPHYLDAVREEDYEAARSRVLAFPGIGPKVADCALLYGFQRFDAFPVDIWILRAMRKIYFRNRSVSEERVHAFGQKRWGAMAGYVQQYLFHGARTGVIY